MRAVHYVFVNNKIEYTGSYYACLGYSSCLLVQHEILKVVYPNLEDGVNL